jgi:hypothetical protein
MLKKSSPQKAQTKNPILWRFFASLEIANPPYYMPNML